MEAPHVLWLDNFSKGYAMSVPNLKKTAYASCLWTGIAVHRYVGEPVDLTVHEGSVAFPLNTIIPQRWHIALKKGMEELDKKGPKWGLGCKGKPWRQACYTEIHTCTQRSSGSNLSSAYVLVI